MTEQQASPTPPRRRRSDEERIKALAERKQEIEAKLASLTARKAAADRKQVARRKIVVGALLLAHAEVDPQFRRRLSAGLRMALAAIEARDPKAAARDRLLIADLLDDAPSSLSDERPKEHDVDVPKDA